MDNDRYLGEDGTGPFLGGCLAAALVGVPLFGFVFLASALGDCIPDAPCNHDLNLWLLGGAILITAATGKVVSAIVRAVRRNRPSDR